MICCLMMRRRPSAAQGKALKGLIDGIPKTEVVDDLLSDEGAKALSAAQGKVLKALIDAIEIPQPGPPGPKGLKWCGAWDADAEYQEDDAVSYMGGSYIAIKASSNKEPPDAEYWGILSAKGADGTGTGDMTKAVYDPDGDGKVDAAVVADHAGAANTATRADTADAVAWDNVTGKPEKFTCDIVDALDSDRADAALSAKQGKALKGFVDEKANVTHTHEIDDITQLAATLQNKADLVNGKVPETQLPSSIGNGLSAPTTSTFLAFGCSDKTGVITFCLLEALGYIGAPGCLKPLIRLEWGLVERSPASALGVIPSQYRVEAGQESMLVLHGEFNKGRDLCCILTQMLLFDTTEPLRSSRTGFLIMLLILTPCLPRCRPTPPRTRTKSRMSCRLRLPHRPPWTR